MTRLWPRRAPRRWQSSGCRSGFDLPTPPLLLRALLGLLGLRRRRRPRARRVGCFGVWLRVVCGAAKKNGPCSRSSSNERADEPFPGAPRWSPNPPAKAPSFPLPRAVPPRMGRPCTWCRPSPEGLYPIQRDLGWTGSRASLARRMKKPHHHPPHGCRGDGRLPTGSRSPSCAKRSGVSVLRHGVALWRPHPVTAVRLVLARASKVGVAACDHYGVRRGEGFGDDPITALICSFGFVLANAKRLSQTPIGGASASTAMAQSGSHWRTPGTNATINEF